MTEHFKGAHGCVWRTEVRRAEGEGAKNLPHGQLLQDLRGFGKGRAKWTDPVEVAQAANYVEQWSEHLLDWQDVDAGDVADAVGRSFERGARWCP